MSLMGLFDLGRSGLFASQKALRVASNNVSNVNTPGYSRQYVIIKAASPILVNGNYMGRGIGDVDIRRHFDNFIFYQILGQSSGYGESYSTERSLSHIEQIFNEARDFGLSNSMEDYFNSWQEVATNPAGTAQRSSLLVKAEAFVNTAKQMEKDLKSTLEFINDEIGDTVKQINVITKNLAILNGKIMEVEAGGMETASIFRDQREEMMKELAEIVDYDWYEDKDGSVTVVAGRGSIVTGVQSFDLSTALVSGGDRHVYNSTGSDITAYFKKGRLGGYISVKSDIQNNTLLDIRKLVASITQETNFLHTYTAANTVYDLDGDQGTNFFNTLSAFYRDDTPGRSGAAITATIPDSDPSVLTSLDEYDIVFLTSATYQVRNHATGAVVGAASNAYTSGANIDINGVRAVITGTGASAPAADDTFFVSPVHSVIENFSVAITDGRDIAAAQAATTLPGDNSNALAIVNINGASITNLNSSSFNDHYAEIVTTVGSLTQSATDSLEFEDNLLFELKNRRDAVSAVSLDEEAANLIRYQRAFEASARIIKITDELLELVLNL